MANADKVWQGLSASDMVVEQCCCKSLSGHRLFGDASDMLYRRLLSFTFLYSNNHSIDYS